MIATETTHALSLSRLFQSSPETVFHAWTSREELLQWWCPPGFSVASIDIDLRPGGQYRYAMRRNQDGAVFTVFGEFLEVRRAQRLAYTWSWDAPNMAAVNTHVTVTFEPEGNGTRLTVTHERFTTVAMQQTHQLGWTGCFDRLTGKHGNGAAREEYRVLVEELREARRSALKELLGLNEAQWSFRTSPERWSIAENTEHIADGVESGVSVLRNLTRGPLCAEDLSGNDDALRKVLRDRSQKFKADTPPAGVESMPEARARFVGSIEDLATLLEQSTEDLRRYAAKSPPGVLWDGVQWAIATAEHTLRHVDQIREVKASPGYPA